MSRRRDGNYNDMARWEPPRSVTPLPDVLLEFSEFDDELPWLEADGVSDLDELEEVEAPLAVLVLGDEGLWPMEFSGQALLREVCVEPFPLQEWSEKDASGREA